MDIKAGLQAIVDELVAAGIKASLDNSKLNAPCAWVHPGPINPRDHAGNYTMTAQVTLIAANSNDVANLDNLNQILELALSRLTPDGPIETDAVAELPNGKRLPAFTFPLDTDL